MSNKFTDNKPLVLITRPFEDAVPLGEQLQKMGFEIFIEPMMTINIDHQQIDKLSEMINQSPQVIIITSANGLSALSELSGERNIPILTVGQSSKEAALQLGYQNVQMPPIEDGGDCNGIIKYVKQNCHQGDLIVYISGDKVTGDIVNKLQKQCFKVENIILYEGRKATNLSSELISNLRNNHINKVLFYSSRTVQIFLELINKYEVESALKQIDCYCLSKNIAQLIAEKTFKNIYIAKNPTRDSMLGLIKEK